VRLRKDRFDNIRGGSGKDTGMSLIFLVRAQEALRALGVAGQAMSFAKNMR